MTRFRTVQPLNPVEWLVLPALASALATLLMATPVKIYGVQLPEPVFAFAPAFAWAVIRASLAPPLLITLLGLYQDMLWGGPLGLWPLCLLTVYGLAFGLRRFLAGEDFWPLAAWYGGFCAIAFLLGAVLSGVAAGEAPNLIGVLLQFAVTLALYPLAWLLVQRFEDADVRFR